MTSYFLKSDFIISGLLSLLSDLPLLGVWMGGIVFSFYGRKNHPHRAMKVLFLFVGFIVFHFLRRFFSLALSLRAASQGWEPQRLASFFGFSGFGFSLIEAGLWIGVLYTIFSKKDKKVPLTTDISQNIFFEKIRYRRSIGMTFIAFNILLLIFNILLGRPSLFLLAPLLTTIVGILFLTRTYFEIFPDKLVMKALVGPYKKIVIFNSVNQLSVEGKHLFVTTKEEKNKVRGISPFLRHPSDWEKLVCRLKTEKKEF